MTMRGGETTKRLCIIFMAAAFFCIAMFPGKGFAASPTLKTIWIDFRQDVTLGTQKLSGTGSVTTIKYYSAAGVLLSSWSYPGVGSASMGTIINVPAPPNSLTVRYIEYGLAETTATITGVTTYSGQNGSGTATNRPFDSSESNPISTDPPNAPTGLIAVPSEEKVTISWDAVSRSTGYNVYLDGVKVGSITDRTYTFSLTTIKQYTFSVSAINSFGESARTSVTATPIAPPKPPDPPDTTPPSVPVLSGKPGKNQAVLTWTRSPESDLAGYNLYQDGSKVGNYATNSATVSGLTNGKEYKFQVTSVDTTGNESAKSNQIAVTPVEKMDVNLIPNGDSIVVQIVSGGTGPYVINWGAAQKTVDQSQYVIQNLKFDTEYMVTITDANGLTYTSKINTGTEKGYVPPTMPSPQTMFQKMIDVFAVAGKIAIAVIGGAVLLGIMVLLARYGWMMLKGWLAKAK